MANCFNGEISAVRVNWSIRASNSEQVVVQRSMTCAELH